MKTPKEKNTIPANIDASFLKAIDIVLVKPRYGGNIGSVARAIKNMGLGGLVLVNSERYMPSEARMMAASAQDILDQAEKTDGLEDIIGRYDLVLGVSRRVKSSRQRIMTPRQAARFLSREMVGKKVALMFGPEDSGLTARELSQCHGIVSIPSHEDYPSLNLAQSVMILAYELRMILDPELNSVHTYSGSSERDMEELYLQIETVLERTGFFIRNPEKNVMVHLKDILSSGIETSRDVRIFRGIFRRIAWHLNKEDRTKV